MYVPSWPVCSADDGTTSALGCKVSRIETFTNSPGQSLRSVLRKVPFSLIVPVVASTLLSINVSSPCSTSPPSSCDFTSTGSLLPVPMKRRISGKRGSGTAKVTLIGSTWARLIRSVWFPLTMLPAFTVMLPRRPSMGDEMVVKLSCKRMFSRLAWSAWICALALSMAAWSACTDWPSASALEAKRSRSSFDTTPCSNRLT